MTGYMHARLLPADPSQLRPEDLPTLPHWYPLPARDDAGNLQPSLPEQERNRARHARAVAEACEGPRDGQREQVRVDGSGMPPPELLLYDASVVYVLRADESTDRQATYRYSPQLSHMHKGSMAAVTAGFAEHGQQYAMTASTTDPTGGLTP